MNKYKNNYFLLYKYILFTCLIFFLSACSTVKPEVEKTQEVDVVSILDIDGFDAFKVTLSHIVNERNPDAKQTQHFYVAKYDRAESYTYMFWAEMKLLWIMPLGDTDEESWLGVRYPSGGELIDLKSDVALTKNDIGSSTYRVSQDWAEERLFDSVIDGDLIIINQ